MKHVAAGFAIALTIGCASAPVQTVVPSTCPEGGLVALGGDTARSSHPPVPRGLFLPPLPPPPDVRGQRMLARLVVDSTGSPMRDSIAVCGLTNAAYSQKVAEVLVRTPFEPARRDGVAASAPVLIAYQF